MGEKLDIDDKVVTSKGLYKIKYTVPLMGVNVFTKFLDFLSLNDYVKITNEQYITQTAS